MMKRLGGGIYQRIRRTYIALVFSTCDEYPDDVLCIPHIRARPNGEQNLITKPKTNEQTFGFLVKTRMEYKHRIRVLRDTGALAAAEYGRLAVWQHSPLFFRAGRRLYRSWTVHQCWCYISTVGSFSFFLLAFVCHPYPAFILHTGTRFHQKPTSLFVGFRFCCFRAHRERILLSHLRFCCSVLFLFSKRSVWTGPCTYLKASGYVLVEDSSNISFALVGCCGIPGCCDVLVLL